MEVVDYFVLNLQTQSNLAFLGENNNSDDLVSIIKDLKNKRQFELGIHALNEYEKSTKMGQKPDLNIVNSNELFGSSLLHPNKHVPLFFLKLNSDTQRETILELLKK
jgi:hypothetical protein